MLYYFIYVISKYITACDLIKASAILIDLPTWRYGYSVVMVMVQMQQVNADHVLANGSFIGHILDDLDQ